MLKQRFDQDFISEMQDIIFAYANGDFTKRLEVSDLLDERDIIVSGINMLGEELEEKSISKNYFLKIFNSIPQIVIIFDSEGIIDLINHYSIEFFIQNKVIFRLNAFDIVPKQILEQFLIFIKSKKYQHKFEVSYSEENDKSLDQSNTKYLMCNILRINKVKSNHFLFVAKDVTEERKEEKRIIKASIIGQETERKRLANDLHDALGQELNAIKMYLNAVELMDTSSSKYLKSMSDIHKMLDDSINSVRNISYNLIPRMVENNDLISCISYLIKQLNSINTIKIKFRNKLDVLNLKDKNDELFIYRIIQEFMNNSLKHSNATMIQLEIKKCESNTCIEFHLRDNGDGFEMQKFNNTNGINNIKNRLESLNIKYNYSSKLNLGTTLIFEIYN